MRRKMRYFCLTLVFFIAVCPAFPVWADAPSVYAADPALPGARVLLLAPDTEAEYLRVNVFSDGESIVSDAVWEGSFARLALLRPLREGECLRILADGNDTYGRPFSVDRILQVSRAGAFMELLQAFSARWQRLAGAPVFPGAEAMLECVPLSGLLLLFPEARLVSPGEILFPGDVLFPFQVAVLNGEGSWCGLSREDGGRRFRFHEVSSVPLDTACGIEIHYRVSAGADYITVTYECLPEDPVRPEGMMILMPMPEGETAVFTADLDGDGWKCILRAKHRGSPDGSVLFETEWRENE